MSNFLQVNHLPLNHNLRIKCSNLYNMFSHNKEIIHNSKYYIRTSINMFNKDRKVIYSTTIPSNKTVFFK